MRKVLPIVAALLTTSVPAHAASCRASWFNAGSRSGVASNAYRVGTPLEACYHGCTRVRVIGTGPFIPGRCLDFSRDKAAAIGLLGVGVAVVTYRLVGP